MTETDSKQAARRTGPALEAAYRFLLWLIPALESLPRTQKFLLGDRIQQGALTVLECLIDATYSRERRVALQQANLQLEKLRLLLRLTFDLKYLDMRRYEHAARELDQLGRMIGGWQKADRAQQGQ